MRDFFINSLEKIVTVIVVLTAVAVFLAGLAAMFSPDGGFFAGIAVWLFGAVYVLVMGGILFLALGVHDNTRRTAAAVEALAAKE